MASAAQDIAGKNAVHAWQGFTTTVSGKKRSMFATSFNRIIRPYEGDDNFLATATTRTKKIWGKLNELFLEERKKGVLDISQIPSSITSHAPGYIDRENELIFGLQTEAPLKRSIMPNGGFRMVLNALKTYGYEPDPHVVETFSQSIARRITKASSMLTPRTCGAVAVHTF